MVRLLAFLIAMHAAGGTPEQRAIDYLLQEVPRWYRENRCMSCHNNGDAARALYAAFDRGFRIPEAALADTTRWLIEPAKWDSNRGSPAFSDKKLARIQFAAALTAAYEVGLVRDPAPLLEAGESLLLYQEANGSWQVDAEMTAGSPATYGPALATYMARRTLETSKDSRFAAAIERANAWFRNVNLRSVLDAAAILLAMRGDERIRRRSLDVILPAQTSDGGWGPQRYAPAEPFDTALVLLALRGLNQDDAIARGREFLIRRQQPEGGWPETTRPAGAQSYAQHMSTSGWAALALLLTNPER